MFSDVPEESLEGADDSEGKPSTFASVFNKPLPIILLGLFLVGVGVFIYFNPGLFEPTKVEIISDANNKSQSKSDGEITVEISGAVQSPGVYKLKTGSRVDDLIVVSGGLSSAADRDYISRSINRASKLVDGQKVYVPSTGDKLEGGRTLGIQGSDPITVGLTNINTASAAELDTLPGIGPVYAQSIIEHRVYSSVEELLSKGALKSSVYEKIKDRVTVGQ